VAGVQLLEQIAQMIGLQGRQGEVIATMNYLANGPFDWPQRLLFLGDLGEGLHRTRSSFALVDPQLQFEALYSAAMGIAQSSTGPEPLRLAATRVVGQSPYRFAETGDWLLMQCAPQPMPALQATVLQALGRYDDAGVFTGLVGHWPAMAPELRRLAVSALLARANRVSAVVDAITKGQIPAVDVSGVNRNFLRTYRDATVSRRAVELFGPLAPHRPEVMQRFKGALKMRGNAEHGRQIYNQRCATCHEPDSSGTALGPVLSGARVRGREKVLESVVEPNADVRPGYAACVVETSEGEILIGIRTEQNPTTIVLRQPTGPVVWPRLNVQSMQTQSWSFMPEGLEEGLTPQDMADLVEWVMTGRFGLEVKSVN
jgi:putative heme-binding domain-containing protein